MICKHPRANTWNMCVKYSWPNVCIIQWKLLHGINRFAVYYYLSWQGGWWTWISSCISVIHINTCISQTFSSSCFIFCDIKDVGILHIYCKYPPVGRGGLGEWGPRQIQSLIVTVPLHEYAVSEQEFYNMSCQKIKQHTIVWH